jgi:hypothetical protein
MKYEFSTEIFEKSTNISGYVVHCGRRESEGAGYYKSSNRTSQVVKTLKCAANLQKACESYGLLTGKGEEMTYYSSAIDAVHWLTKNALISKSPDFKYHPKSQYF